MSIKSLSVTGRISAASKKLTRRQKSWLVGCLIAFIVSVTALVWQTNALTLVELPAAGGELEEGVVGVPRFINPLLAISNADRDLTMLVYSGLLRYNQDGTLGPDLAERYTISEDGREYRFFLKPDLVWHDGEPVTAEDVIFTASRAKDPTIKSPRRAAWEGVEITKISDHEILFTLKQPYVSFLETAALGLLPAHAWKNVTPEAFPLSNLNIEPIGTGPYRVNGIKRDRDNLPIGYELVPFKRSALGQPKLEKLTINFYSNEDTLIAAYQKGRVESLSAVSPAVAESIVNDKTKLLAVPLPRVFAVFFNQNQAKIFAQAEVREALNLLVKREEIIKQVLAGYGQPAYGPWPTDPVGAGNTIYDLASVAATASSTAPEERAAALLTKHGWGKNPDTNLWEQTIKKETRTLAFTLITADTPELKKTAGILKNVWEQFGAKVEIKIFESGALNQNVIRPREYEALLFGEIIGRQPDLYSFWHSSQRLDPGLNIALYANATVDKMLEELKNANPLDDRQEKYERVAAEIVKDTPAIFLYAPNFLYLLPKKIKGISLGFINAPSERFLDIHDWYQTTEKVWPL